MRCKGSGLVDLNEIRWRLGEAVPVAIQKPLQCMDHSYLANEIP